MAFYYKTAQTLDIHTSYNRFLSIARTHSYQSVDPSLRSRGSQIYQSQPMFQVGAGMTPPQRAMGERRRGTRFRYAENPLSYKSLILFILGLFMPLIIGLFIEIFAFYFSIKALRSESQNTIALIAFIGSLLVLLLLLLAWILMPSVFLDLLLFR